MKKLFLSFIFSVFLVLSCVGQRKFAFGEAQWIGGNGEDMGLYAQYLTVFRLSWVVENVSCNGGSEYGGSWLKFGGGDERFTSAWRNIWHIENEADSVFVLVETDCEKGEICFVRSGMDPMGRQSRTFSSEKLKATGKHHIELALAYGTTEVTVDGEKIGTVNLNPARGGMEKGLSLSGDFVAIPCLGKVSYGKGVSALELRHYRSPKNLITSDFKDRSCLQLRTSFSNHKAVEKATLSITSRGIYDAYLNGTLVNEGFYFCPGFTQYDRTQLYQTYDVTSMISDGANRLEVVLAEGWWSGASTYSAQNWNFYGDRQSLLARLTLLYDDGTTEEIVTNPDTWECCSDGARLYASMFNGEVLDGRHPLFDNASNWHRAVVIPTEGTTVEGEDYNQVEFVEQKDSPVHPIDTLTAVSCKEVRPKVFVYDMGQNCAAVPFIRLNNQTRGTTINLRFAEMMYNGEMMTENYRAAISQDKYICRGGDEIFSPRQTLHGFRYIEITGIDEPLSLENVKAIALSSLDGIKAHYECSDTLVNRLWNNLLWSARSNFVSIPTDCPQRNERMGWSGDISVFSHTATYLSDVEEFLRRHLRTMRDTQGDDGRFTDVAPMRGEGFGGLLWGSAGITVAWECYRHWGNLDLLREHYNAMTRYIEFVQKDYIDKSGLLVQHRQWGDLGDWLSPVYDNDDKSLLWECYYIYDLDIMSQIAAAIGKTDDAEAYARLRDERKAFFRKTYLSKDLHYTVWSPFDPKKQGQLVNTQVSYILPLAFDICEGAEREALESHLIKLIEDNDYHLMVGFIGVPWIGEVLSKIGRPDLIYRILACRDYPSWLYPVCQGATTIWERLNSYIADEGFPAGNGMNSFNHYSFGSIGAWLMERSLGIFIECPALKDGIAEFILQPTPDPTGHLTWAKGHYDSRFGRIESAWEYVKEGKVRYTFTIPRGTTATVILPGRKPRKYKAGRYEIK